MEEFKAVIDAHPEADYATGSLHFKSSFLKQALQLSIDEFVDWSKGEVHFERGDFAKLLEYANTFPDDYVVGMWSTEEHELIASGRQIMANLSMWSSGYLQIYKTMFGGELVFKGFPTESRTGNILNALSPLAISTTCTDKEGAWSFVRMVLTEEWQRVNNWSFATNKALFNEQHEKAMTPQGFEINASGNEVEIPKGSWGANDDYIIYIYAMTREDGDKIINLIDSAVGSFGLDESLWNIISEGANDFFNGKNTVEEAVRIIQSRASIYVSEQK